MDSLRLTEAEVRKYLERIHYTGSRDATSETLCELQKCHLLSVPFENLSVYGKEEMVPSKDWFFNKIVRRRRGGSCYELNTLFSHLLDWFGFVYSKHAAGVVNQKTGIIGSPFDHMILMVKIDEQDWLTDVAFGDSFLTPLRFNGFIGKEQRQESGIYRIRQDGDHFYYEEKVKEISYKEGCKEKAEDHFSFRYTDSGWAKRYRFDLLPRTTDDFMERAAFFKTHCHSPFTHSRLCTIAKPWGRITLSGEKLVTSTNLENNKVMKDVKELDGEEEVVKTLEQTFGITA